MLHEMAEDRVDEHVILPVLERSLAPREGADGYWSYLMNQYPAIPYVVGKDVDIPFNPQSAILLYILEKHAFLHGDLVPAEIPHEDIFAKAIYFDIAPDDPCDPSEERRVTWTYRERGMDVEVCRRDMEIDTAKLFEYRTCCQELVAWFESPDCPLLAEYKALRRYCDGLKKKIRMLNEDFLSA